MVATPSRLSTVPFNEPGDNPLQPSTYVSGRVLAQTTAESITIPANAVYVHLVATCNLNYSFTTTAAVIADTDDGTASALIGSGTQDGRWLMIPGGATTLSVCTPDSGGGTVAAHFFTN